MQFYVIYSFDIPSSEYVRRYNPPFIARNGKSKVWDCTEGDEQYDYSYLEGVWTKGKHRKYCGLLTKEQFEEFVSDCNLYPENCETMGSLTEMGWLPAISFNGQDDIISSAYVTPIIKEELMTERNWQRVREVVISKFS